MDPMIDDVMTWWWITLYGKRLKQIMNNHHAINGKIMEHHHAINGKTMENHHAING